MKKSILDIFDDSRRKYERPIISEIDLDDEGELGAISGEIGVSRTGYGEEIVW